MRGSEQQVRWGRVVGGRGCEGVKRVATADGRRGGGRAGESEAGEELDVLVWNITYSSEGWDKCGLEFVDIEPLRSAGRIGHEDKVDWPSGRGKGMEGEGRVLIGWGESHLVVGEGGEDFDVFLCQDVL